jgi:hypothetical protein
LEKHLRKYFRIRVKVSERELADVEKQIAAARNPRDLRTLRMLRAALVNALESNRAWTEAHL